MGVRSVRKKKELTSSACFCAFLSKPLSESLRQDASWFSESAEGCQSDAMMGGGSGVARGRV